MDRTLIETITRLVISKIEEQFEYPSLTDQELNRWREISTSIVPINEVHSHVDVGYDYKPLNHEEITNWNNLTRSLEQSNISNLSLFDREKDKAKIIPYR